MITIVEDRDVLNNRDYHVGPRCYRDRKCIYSIVNNRQRSLRGHDVRQPDCSTIDVPTKEGRGGGGGGGDNFNTCSIS